MNDRRPPRYAQNRSPQGQPERRNRDYADISSYGQEAGDRSINSYSGERPEPPPLSSREERSQRRRKNKDHRKRNRQKGKRNRRIFKLVWFVMVIFLGLATAQFLLTGMNDMLAVDKQKLTVTVEIPKNSDTEEVAQVLYDNGMIEEPGFFQLYSKLTKADGHYQHGTFELTTDMDYEAIINQLQSNAARVDTVKITFREGMNVREVAQLLEENGVCSAEDVLEVANSDELDGFDLLRVIPNPQERYYKLEGYLFPDTYEFYKDEDPVDALSKLVRNTDRKLNQDMLDQIAALEMTPDEILTLASIIEAEAADEEDMYIISSILHNRLENGAETGTAQLGCDSTVYYPYRTKDQAPEGFLSTYDTYNITGLPPGPICNPSLKAIEAAISPQSTNYYYFCHDKDGNAYYAETASGHQRNLEKAGLA